MNRTFLLRSLVGVAALALSAGSAMAYPALANQVVVDAGDATPACTPRIDSSDQEFAGPNARIIVRVPANGVLAASTALTQVRIVALNSAGAEIGVYVCAAGDLQGGFQSTNGAGAVTQQINLDATAGDNSLYTISGIAAIGVTLSNNGTPNDSNSVATRFALGDEATDACFHPDAQGPRITSVILSGALPVDNGFFVQFDEPLSTTGIGDNGATGATETTLGSVTQADFQYLAAAPFTFADGTASPTSALSDQTFFGGNTIIRFDAGAGDLAVGGQLRPITMAGAGTGDVRDIAGNRAVQAVLTDGVAISAPPAFTITSVGWRGKVNAGATPASVFAVTYSTPVDAGFLGNATFYSGVGDDNLQLAGADSDRELGGAISADPNNPNTVLVSIVNGGGSNNNDVRADGRSSDNSQYTWNYMLEGTQPRSLFSPGADSLASPGGAFTVADQIKPSRQFLAFHDLSPSGAPDGKIDAYSIVYDEPVTTSLTAGGTTLRKINATVQPVGQIDPITGALVNDDVVASGTASENVLPILAQTIGNVRLAAPDNIDRLQTGNAIVSTINPDAINWDNSAATTPGSAQEAIPGSAGPAHCTIETAAAFTVTDANSNVLDEAAIAATNIGTDRAPPIPVIAWFFTGDNQTGGGNDQFFSEQDGVVGDSEANDRASFALSENVGAAPTTRNRITYRNGARNLGGSGVVFFSSNTFALSDNAFVAPDGVEVGDTFLFQTGNGGTDGSGNEITGSATSLDCVAPYVPLDTSFGGSVKSVFLVDSDADGFANSINVRFALPVLASTFAQTDFTVTPGMITGAVLAGDGLNAVISLDTTAANRVNMTGTVTFTYRGASDSNRIARNGFPNNRVRAADDVINNVGAVPQPARETQDISIMTMRGTIMDGTTPAPIGTRVEVMLATPRAGRVTYVHNNIPGVIADYTFDYDGFYSLNAFTNWMLGLSPNVYMHRGVIYDSGSPGTSQPVGNIQYFANCKDAHGPDTADGYYTTNLYDQTIALTFTASTLNNITFTGRGEASSNTITNGRVELCWDTLRTNSGNLEDLYYTPEDGNQCDLDDSSGYAIYGNPITSNCVIDNTNGLYEIHISAPNSALQGGGFSRLSGLSRPLIVVVTYPNGNRYICSSLTTTVNGGGPLVFQPNNGGPQTTGAGNPARETTQFNINVANVGQRHIHRQWNIVPHDRVSGYATTAANQPSPFPVGIAASNFAPVSSLPGVGPLQQFVFFTDNDNDGVFTVSDGGLDNIVIDPCNFVDFFAFTMNNQGVRVNRDINSICGGQAFGFYYNDYVWGRIGMTTLGAPMNSASVFPASGTFFPNNTTTFGWALGTCTTNSGFATPGAFFTANPRADYIIIIKNTLDIDGKIRVFSQDADTSDTDEINNVGMIEDGTGMFIHYRSN